MRPLNIDEHYAFDPTHRLWKIEKYNYAQKRWEFLEWMPHGWEPPHPSQQSSQQQSGQHQDKASSGAHSTQHTRNDSGHSRTSSLASSDKTATSSSGPRGAVRTATDINRSPPIAYSAPATSPQYSLNQNAPYQHSGRPGYPSGQTSSTRNIPNVSTQYSNNNQVGAWPSSKMSPTTSRSYSHSTTSLPRGRGQTIEGSYAGPHSLHYEDIDPAYYVRSNKFFTEGKVFAVIMNETAGSNSTANPTDYNTSTSINSVKYNDNLVYTNNRRFIVVRSRPEFCFACPIYTYSNRATLKRGVRPSEHGIAYSAGYSPELLPGEFGINKRPVAIIMAEGEKQLSKASRVYYGIHHPIQYNVKVKDIGHVRNKDIPILIGNWREEDESDTRQDADVTEGAGISIGSSQANAHSSHYFPPAPLIDKHMYDPEKNPYGYDSTKNPHMYHPSENPFGYHPDYNIHGFHPESNPFSYHPRYNPYGHHPTRAPFCYHPSFSVWGYHANKNRYGFHPITAPYSYHPQSNVYGYHPAAAPNNYHPQHNPYGYHPKENFHHYHPQHNPLGYHPKIHAWGYHPTANPDGYHSHYNPYGYHPQASPNTYHRRYHPDGIAPNAHGSTSAPLAEESEDDDDDDDDNDTGAGAEEDEEAAEDEDDDDDDNDQDVNQLAETLSNTTMSQMPVNQLPAHGLSARESSPAKSKKTKKRRGFFG